MLTQGNLPVFGLILAAAVLGCLTVSGKVMRTIALLAFAATMTVFVLGTLSNK